MRWKTATDETRDKTTRRVVAISRAKIACNKQTDIARTGRTTRRVVLHLVKCRAVSPRLMMANLSRNTEILSGACKMHNDLIVGVSVVAFGQYAGVVCVWVEVNNTFTSLVPALDGNVRAAYQRAFSAARGADSRFMQEVRKEWRETHGETTDV